MSIHKTYLTTIQFNGRAFSSVVISQHYKKGHPEMNDEMILALVQLVAGKQHDPEDTADENGFQYIRIEPLELKDKPYRLVLTTCETEDFWGVINAFRVEKKK